MCIILLRSTEQTKIKQEVTTMNSIRSKVMTTANRLVKGGLTRSAAMVKAWALAKADGLRVKIAGTSFRQKALEALAKLRPQDVTVQLRREPHNSYDSNAIGVYATAPDRHVVFGEINADKVNQVLDVADNTLSNAEKASDEMMRLIYEMSKSSLYDKGQSYEDWRRQVANNPNNLNNPLFGSFNSNPNPAFQAIQNTLDNIQATQHMIIKNNQPINVTIGDVKIENPVQDVRQLAQEVVRDFGNHLVREMPNAMQRVQYTNLKR